MKTVTASCSQEVIVERAARRPGLLTTLVRRRLAAMQRGRVVLDLPNGDRIVHAGPLPGPDADLKILSWRTLWRLMSAGDIGLARSYLDGEWTTSDLMGVLDFGIANREGMSDSADGWPLMHMLNRIGHQRRRNSRRGSRRNIAAHYDLGNAFYEKWLDAGMNYSSALYAEPSMTLEQAQIAKLDRIVEMLGVRGGENVLEIGCGWGALAERLVRDNGCSITGVTLSHEQHAWARQRLAPEIADGRADIRIQDYRDITETFDHVASIEMFEAVGEKYWPAYFDKLNAVLAPGGNAVLQIITIDEQFFESYRKRPDYIQTYIFPGGMLPCVRHVHEQAEAAGFEVVEQQPFGRSYADTLAEWKVRFLDRWAQIEPLGFDDRFRRMWEYYLAYCEAGFRAGWIDVSLFKLKRRT